METCAACGVVIGAPRGAGRTFSCIPCQCPLCFSCAAWSVNETEACVNCGVPATGLEQCPVDAGPSGPIVVHSSDSESAASETDDQEAGEDLDTSDGDTGSSAESVDDVSGPDSDASGDSTGSLFAFGVQEEPLRPTTSAASAGNGPPEKRARTLGASD